MPQKHKCMFNYRECKNDVIRVPPHTELLLQAVPSRRRCWWREGLCILLWVVIASAVPATIILTVKHHTLDVTHLGYEGDTVELLRVNGFWYEFLKVSQIVKESDDEHRVQLYLPLCSDIEIHEKSSYYRSPVHQHSQATRQMGVMEYLYLLVGSSVTYSFCMKSNTTEDVSGSQFFVFNDQIKYMEYVYGGTNGEKTSVYSHKLANGLPQGSLACLMFTFIAKKNSYYFMTGSSAAGVTYQYNISIYTKFLNFSDYKENKSCSALTVKHKCEIPVGSQFLSKSEEYCLLAHTIPRSEGNKKKKILQTTHLRVNAGKRGEVIVIPIMVIVVGVVGLLVVVVTYCCCCCKKCCWGRRSSSRHYTLINA